jgi:amidase
MAIEFAVTRTVRDAAALLDVVAGPMPGDPYAALTPARAYREEVGAPCGRLRIGLLSSLSALKIHPDCVAAVESSGRLLESLGHHVQLAHPDLENPELTTGLLPIIATSQARLIERFSAAIGRTISAEDMDCDNWAVTELGKKVSGTEYLAAIEVLNRYTRRVAGWWAEGFDLLVSPTLPEPPPPIGELVPDPREPLKGFQRSGALTAFTLPFNVTGQPAFSLPLHWTPQGLPVGVQLVAAMDREDLLIRVASQLEQEQPWIDRLPPVHA